MRVQGNTKKPANAGFFVHFCPWQSTTIRLHPWVNAGKNMGKFKSWKFFTHMALTDIQIKQAKPGDKQYRLTNQNGLYLRVLTLDLAVNLHHIFYNSN